VVHDHQEKVVNHFSPKVIEVPHIKEGTFSVQSYQMVFST